jgi:hypothetical protein
MRIQQWVFCILVGALLSGGAVQAGRYDDQPAAVTVQHILIGFKRSVPGKKIDRSKDEARELANELFERAQGMDQKEFNALVEEYTDDSPPGIYLLVNEGQPMVRGARKRREMVPRFGDVAFDLDVGEVGLANYHGGNSPYGWHIIMRLE